MTDEPIEGLLRAWLADHVEWDTPASLERHLDALVAGGRPVGPRDLVPVTAVRRISGTTTTSRGRFRALAAALAIALVGGGLIYGLALRVNPAVSGSPSPRVTASPPDESRSPAGFPSPSAPPAAGTGPFSWTLVSSAGDLATYDFIDAIHRRNGGDIGIAFGQDSRTVHSDAGRSWVLDPVDPGLVTTSPDHIAVADAIAEGPAGLVIVGASALDDFSSGVARAWTSVDGRTWRPATGIGGDPNAEMKGVVGGEGEYVAVGSEGFPGANTQLPGAHGAAAWTSPDGATWTRVPAQAAFGGAIMTGIAATPNGYVAWGEIMPLSQVPNQPLPIWTSTDGVHWGRTASGRGETFFSPIGGIVMLAGRWVAVGTSHGEDGSHPMAWVSSDAGRTWVDTPIVPVTSGAQPAGYAFDVAAVDHDLIAVGHVEDPGTAGGQTSAAVWRSTDMGLSWAPLPVDPSFRGATASGILAVDENRFVVFGQANDLNALANPTRIWLATRQP